MNSHFHLGVHFLYSMSFHLVRMTGIEPASPYSVKGYAATAYFLIYIIYYDFMFKNYIFLSPFVLF